MRVAVFHALGLLGHAFGQNAFRFGINMMVTDGLMTKGADQKAKSKYS